MINILVIGDREITSYQAVSEAIQSCISVDGYMKTKGVMHTFNDVGVCNSVRLLGKEWGIKVKEYELDNDSEFNSTETFYRSFMKTYKPTLVLCVRLPESDQFNYKILENVCNLHNVLFYEYVYQPTEVILDCSMNGDKRFSELFARVTLKENYRDNIRNLYKRTRYGEEDRLPVGEEDSCSRFKCPFTGKFYPKQELEVYYVLLWYLYLAQNPAIKRAFDVATHFICTERTKPFRENGVVMALSDLKYDIASVKELLSDSSWYNDIKHLLIYDI